MITILEVYQELTAQHLKQLANWISTVEQRYQEDGQVTKHVADYKKHPTENIWFFVYSDISSNMGAIGTQIMGFFLGNYLPTGNPVINPEVITIKQLTNKEYDVYSPELMGEDDESSE